MRGLRKGILCWRIGSEVFEHRLRLYLLLFFMWLLLFARTTQAIVVDLY